nr:hypothetical protein [Mycolicibacterium chubuense]
MAKIGYFLSCEQFGAKETCGPDAERHAAQVRSYLDADIDEVYVQQIGLDMDGLFGAWARDVLPQLRG